MTKRTHHARLKPIDGKSRSRILVWALLAGGVLFTVIVALWGLIECGTALQTICNEQCRVVDPDLDVVVVTPGKMVQPDVVTLHFGLTNGANLAEIDFAALRDKLLSRVPNIRDIAIERRLPNRVTIEVKEREPIARVVGAAKNSPSGLMVDAEGMIFRFARSAAAFPVVRAADDMKAAPGERLTGRSAAALRLLEVAAQPEFLSLNVQEANAAFKDYVLVTLGNYSRAKVAWDHMDEDSHVSRESLRRQLKRLTQALATGLVSPTTTWIATDYGTPGRVYAAQNDR
ncbi:MAG: FtsQ-type POTRA domain-containing protein [Kiritimatiellae bacterium]|nr:FtsQ-type POTRA domain-containing protein [Kiritimatiellia bacterium]